MKSAACFLLPAPLSFLANAPSMQGRGYEGKDTTGPGTGTSSANDKFDALARSLAHDLRSSIFVISGFGEALERELDGRASRRASHYLHRIRAAGKQLEDCVDAVLSLAHVTQADFRTEDVDLSAMATSIVGDLKFLEPGRAVECHVQEGLVDRGDPRLLRMALENLLGNACKFSSGSVPARISFSMRAESGQERVYEVADNGAGFDKANAAKLFTPFGRLHSHDEFPGTGLGLANVHRILARHGGRIWADSTPGHGAKFYFTLAASSMGPGFNS